jgi:hypothetical protein
MAPSPAEREVWEVLPIRTLLIACGSEVPHHLCGSFFALRGEKVPPR